jgi:hypothetical protein
LTLFIGKQAKVFFHASDDGVIGKVIQNFRNTAYIATNSGDLICLTVYPIRSPINVNLERVNVWPENQSLVYKLDNKLTVGDLAIDFNNSPVYEGNANYTIAEGVEERAYEAANTISVLAVQGSILDSKSIFFEKLSSGIKAIAQTVQQGDFERLQRAIPRVLGLGAGSTPSGDDFLAGMLFFLNKILESSGREPLVFSIPGKTGWVSKRFIEYAQAGYVSEPIDEMAHSLAIGDSEGMVSAIADLGRVGHSSGIDASVGVLIALCHEKEERFLNSLFRKLRI